MKTHNERPILFSAPMVRAILAGTKTQTRRVVKNVPDGAVSAGVITSSTHSDSEGEWWWLDAMDLMEAGTVGTPFRCPYGQPGDRLYVRETFALECSVEGRDQPLPYSDGRPVRYAPEDDWEGVHPGWLTAHYRATDPAPNLTCDLGSCAQCRDHDMGPHWRPSIHMPRWASRIDLEISSVRVERLNAINEVDAIVEGSREWAAEQDTPVRDIPAGETHLMYRQLWESINGAGSWDADPWVWVVQFKRVDP